MREFSSHTVLSMSDSTKAVSSKCTQDLSVQIVFFTFSFKWFLCFYFWAVIWTVLLTCSLLCMLLRQLARAHYFPWACVSAHITKARIIGARALKTLWRHLNSLSSRGSREKRKAIMEKFSVKTLSSIPQLSKANFSIGFMDTVWIIHTWRVKSMCYFMTNHHANSTIVKIPKNRNRIYFVTFSVLLRSIRLILEYVWFVLRVEVFWECLGLVGYLRFCKLYKSHSKASLLTFF